MANGIDDHYALINSGLLNSDGTPTLFGRVVGVAKKNVPFYFEGQGYIITKDGLYYWNRPRVGGKRG